MRRSNSRGQGPILLCALACLFLTLPAICSTTWYVDAGVPTSGNGLWWATAKKTIQEAVDAASSGDQVWVAEGVYPERVTIGSPLSLYGGFSRSETCIDDRDLSAHSTTLDGGAQSGSRCFLLDDPSTFVIDGFNTQNADMGMYGAGHQGVIRNCSFTKSAYSGVWIDAYYVEIEGCRFFNNLGTVGNGGSGLGLSCFANEPSRVRNCVFENNSSTWLRGAIFIRQAIALEISSCVIRNNPGVGIQLDDSGNTSIDRCTITNNLCGISCFGAAISNCLIANNHAYNGAGINCLSASVSNCTFYGNVATGDDGYGGPPGGAIYCASLVFDYPPFVTPGRLDVTNCIFHDNAPNGIGFFVASKVTPKNNLFYGNAYAAQSGGKDGDYPAAADVNTLPGASGNLDGDPAFANAAAGDFHLTAGSAAIDRGTSVSLAWDLNGAPRPVDIPGVGVDGPFAYDIGASEYQFLTPIAPPSLSGAADAGGGEVGLAWTDDNATTPSQFLSFAYDVYAGEFAPRGWAGTMWYPFLPPARSGPMNVAETGAYFAWISDQWWDGTWLACLNPAALIVYSGTPHAPIGLWVEKIAGSSSAGSSSAGCPAGNGSAGQS
ncbi:MAG: right-handed parallel beta-helix repeat-containing protein, partial [Candidatus Sumerlaeota bacterium]|nr:right-handed parallel beta-helix repeat-containing protein [Candidatus Sumerlaeota bacterium]